MARTVSRTKEINPYESAAITEVRVKRCGAELASPLGCLRPHQPGGGREHAGGGAPRAALPHAGRAAGWRGCRGYIDNDASAFNGRRPDFERMLADLRDGRIGV